MSRTDLDTWETKKQRSRKKVDGEAGQQGIDFVTKLGAAKHALALAEKMPNINELITNAEAVKAAAQALHISAPGVNAWTRFVIDAERKGYACVQEMRKEGELVDKAGGGSPTKGRTVLKDLIDGQSPRTRLAEWALLANLTEFQLDELERIANDEDRLLTRTELFKLAKASMPESTEKPEKIRDVKELEAIARAQEIAGSEGFVGELIQISDDAKVNKDERGWWVEAYVFIEDELTRSDYDTD